MSKLALNEGYDEGCMVDWWLGPFLLLALENRLQLCNFFLHQRFLNGGLLMTKALFSLLEPTLVHLLLGQHLLLDLHHTHKG